MKLFLITGLAVVCAFSAASFVGVRSADAVIHEIVAAYCSGGGVGAIDEDGFLEPEPLADFEKQTFAKPVLASGAVDPETLTVTDKPNAKFAEGSSALALTASDATHPSAEHCPKNALP